jgi:flagellin
MVLRGKNHLTDQPKTTIKEDKMGLRIQNNVMAMNAHKNLQAADSAMSKSLERLSSGYRINRAADDAAGLAISQGFRADIASFKVASRNTTEASALLQVAEGGMDQIGNILTRLKELATQAASSNVGTTERSKLNAEGNALISEIDRIANSTKYGSTSLLDGTFGASKSAGTFSYSAASQTEGLGVYGELTHVYCTAGTGETANIFSGSFISSLTSGVSYSGSWTLSATGTTLTLGNGSITESTTITAFSAVSAANMSVSFANIGMTMSLSTLSAAATSTTVGNDTTISLRETGLTSLNVTGAASGTYTFSAAANGSVALGNGTATQTISNITPGTAVDLNFTTLGVTLSLGTSYTEDDIENLRFVVTDTGSGGNTFQIGAQNNSNNQISLSLTGVNTTTLNSGLTVDKLDTQTEAQSMLTTIDSAISQLSAARGTIGASMNRLSYAAANLATTIENMQAAESVIRDVDMAAEMTDFTKNQILLQAGTAMLAQANMAPQQILSLFG